MDLVAGPQGSGKSTFFPVSARGVDSFNIDDHRRALNQGSAQDVPDPIRRKAAADYEAFIETHVRKRDSFSIEVTLAKEITFLQAHNARQSGFRVQLTFVAAELGDCITRMAIRVDRGGHGVPASVVRTTFAASMRNLPRALAEFDLVEVYDNSRHARVQDATDLMKPKLVLVTKRGQVTYCASGLPAWLKEALAKTAFKLKE